MQVYIGGPLRIKTFRDLELYNHIAEMISKIGLKPYIPHVETARVDEKVNEAKLYKQNINALNLSSFAVFEITHPSHGVGMEIQHALVNGIPFLCIAKRGYYVSKMIKGNLTKDQIVRYSDMDELERKLSKKITSGKFKHFGEISANISGKFISFEGMDCTGKSTLCSRIAKTLKKDKKDVVQVADPPCISPWTSFKEFFEKDKKISTISDAIFLLSARLDNFERIIGPALNAGKIVLSDRFVDSWFAYQSLRLRPHFDSISEALDFLIELNERLICRSFLRMPDLTILVIDDPSRIAERIALRDSVSKYENPETQQNVQTIYLKLAERYSSRFKVIDATNKDLETVAEEAYGSCQKLLR